MAAQTLRSVGAFKFPSVDGEEGKSTTINTLCTSQYTTDLPAQCLLALIQIFPS